MVFKLEIEELEQRIAPDVATVDLGVIDVEKNHVNVNGDHVNTNGDHVNANHLL